MLPRLSALALALSAPLAHAQSSKFDILIGGKLAGHDTFSLSSSGKGVKLSSRFTFSYLTTNPSSATPYKVSVDRTDEFKYDPSFHYLEGQSEDMEEHHFTGFIPNKPRTEMVVTYKYQGQADSETQHIGPNLVVLTSFDPGAAQAALKLLAVAAPPSVSVYNGGQGGASQASGGRGGKAASPSPPGDEKSTDDATWAKTGDAVGSQDGKPLAVHVFTLTAAHNKWVFYADDANDLLELTVTSPPLIYIRSGFRLNPVTAP